MTGGESAHWYRMDLDFGKAPLHVGSGQGPEAPDMVVQADTLFGALCHAWLDLYGAESLEHLLAQFKQAGEAPFLISSAFPRVDKRYYLPRPFLPLAEPPPEGHAKTFKKIRYLSAPVFRDWIHHGTIDAEVLDQDTKTLEDAIKDYVMARVTLDRFTAAGNLFHVRMVSFKPGEAGLYFLVRTTDPEIIEPLKAALKLLGEMGLGGRRSIGAGTFTANCVNVTDDPDWRFLTVAAAESANPEPQGYCLLSTMVPGADELPALVQRGYWEILDRGGWSRSPRFGRQARRKWVRMFAPGSVLAGKPRGQMVDVRPDDWSHAVWRYGLALAAPIWRPIPETGTGDRDAPLPADTGEEGSGRG